MLSWCSGDTGGEGKDNDEEGLGEHHDAFGDLCDRLVRLDVIMKSWKVEAVLDSKKEKRRKERRYHEPQRLGGALTWKRRVMKIA